MGDTLRDLSLRLQVGKHTDHRLARPDEIPLRTNLPQPPAFVGRHRFLQTPEPGRSVVKIGNGFVQPRTRQIGEHALELAEGPRRLVSRPRLFDRIVGRGSLDKQIAAPKGSLVVTGKRSPIPRGHNGQTTTGMIGHSRGHQLLAHLRRHPQDIFH